VRGELVEWLDTVPARVLEVGCGSGNTLAYLKERGAAHTCGIELDPQVAEEARGRVDHLLVGDIDQIKLPYEPGTFDCIIFGDVLEHLRDPWGALEKLTAFLRPGGVVLASIPNVRFYGVSLRLLLLGRWDYREEGILDRTHLRFFTRRSMRQLFQGAGLQVQGMRSVYGPKRAAFNLFTLGLFRDLLARQHLIKAVKG